MNNEDFDPCECAWNRIAMERLISILRQTQNYCTDNECFNIPTLPNPSVPSGFDLLTTFLVFGFALLMYTYRPNSLRAGSSEAKTGSDGPDSTGDPPTPPPTAS